MTEVASLDQLGRTFHQEVFDKPRPGTIHFELAAGKGLAPHPHPGADIVFYVIDGELSVTLNDETYDLSTGDIVRYSGDREIVPKAVEDALALILFAPAQ